jgi:hypothetical protein
MAFRALVTAAIMLLASRCSVAQPDTLWSAMPDLGGRSIFYGATPCANGDIVLVGSIDNGGSATLDMLIVRMSADGEVIWSTRPSEGYDEGDQAAGVVELANGELRVVGFTGISGSSQLTVFDLTATGTVTNAWHYRGNGRAKGMGIARYPDGDLAVVGYGSVGLQYGSDAWFLRKWASGDTLWSVMPRSEGIDAYASVALQHDYVMMAGYDQGNNGEYEAWIAKYDTAMQWTRSNLHYESGDQLLYASTLSNSDQIYAGGRAGWHPYLMKANANADFIWWRTIWATGSASGQIRGLATYRDEQPLCAGWLDRGAGPRCWLMLSDSSGDSLWSWDYAVGDSAGFYGITRLDGGGYAAYGYGRAGAQTRGYVLRIAQGGGVAGTVRNAVGAAVSGVRVRALGQAYEAVTGVDGRFILELSAGTHRLVYSGACIETDTTDEFVLSPDTLLPISIIAYQPALGPLPTSLNVLAHNHEPASVDLILRNFGDGALYYAVTVLLEDPDHDNDWMEVVPASGEVPALSGDTLHVNVSADTTDDGTYEYYGRVIVHTNSCPDTVTEIPVFVTVLDAAVPEELAREFAVSDVYPNPFNGQTSFSMALPHEANVVLRIYDITGRTVRALNYGQLSAGAHSISLDLGELAAGTYFLKVRAGEFSTVRKLLLTK